MTSGSQLKAAGPVSCLLLASFPALPLLAKIKLEKLRDRKVWYTREQPHAFGWRGRNVDDVDIVGQTAHARFTRVLPASS